MMSDAMYRLLHAAEFAAIRHKDQRRKDAAASPYINHPLAVAAELARHGIEDPVTLMAAVLHDIPAIAVSTGIRYHERSLEPRPFPSTHDVLEPAPQCVGDFPRETVHRAAGEVGGVSRLGESV